jgi:DUF1680 family protein
MKKIILSVIIPLLLQSCRQQPEYNDYPISMVNIKNVELTDSFWLPKIKTVQNTSIKYGIEKCVFEGRLDNFLIAGKKKKGKVKGKMPFDDTDVYKIIEGASYSLISAPNKALKNYLDSIIAIIKIGQEPDGYLTTWFTIDPENPPAPWVNKTGKRWTGVVSSHELYNSGHLFHAAAAHYIATGKRNFLDIALKNADLLVESFGPGKLTLPPGHQIVETGLVKLYRITKNENYLKLAKYFLDLRGDSTTHKLYGEYAQDDKPVKQQTEIEGHAVRAVYMYAGMTDIGTMYNDTSYLHAVKNIWTNMVNRKMYITGGLGARHEGESFGNDYELPNLSAYAETCASIGDVLWNIRLFELSGESRYFDIIERTMYNGLISGISLDGKKFFYVNPLEADGKFAFNQGAKTRQGWFDCSCCPTNLIRFIPSIPGIIYATRNDTLYVNLFASNKARVTINNSVINIKQQTDYPWDGKIRLSVHSEDAIPFTLKFRIPGWTNNQVMPGNLYNFINQISSPVKIKVNGKDTDYYKSKGYACINRTWKSNDQIELILPMVIKYVAANKMVNADSNLTALEYGPLVYCFEEIDNSSLDKLTMPEDVNLRVVRNDKLLGGINEVVGDVPAITGKGKLRITAIPYYAWSNRGEGSMKVWLPRK